VWSIRSNEIRDIRHMELVAVPWAKLTNNADFDGVLRDVDSIIFMSTASSPIADTLCYCSQVFSTLSSDF
jgi:hypothetical protein